jgi:hypothetical protein
VKSSYNIHEVADLTRQSYHRIYCAVHEGKIEAEKKNRHWMISREEMLRVKKTFEPYKRNVRKPCFMTSDGDVRLDRKVVIYD